MKPFFVLTIALLYGIELWSQNESSNLKQTVLFESGMSELGAKERARVMAWAEQCNINFDSISVVGHTSAIGSQVDNKKLGLARAQYVSALLKLYFQDITINSRSMGERILAGGSPSLNRRVEIVGYPNKDPLTKQAVLGEMALGGNDDKGDDAENKKPKPVYAGIDSYFTGEESTSEGVKVYYNETNVEVVDLVSALSTESMIENELYAFDVNGDPLITGGMISLDLKMEGNDTLKIEIPSTDYDPEMKIYVGTRDADGNIGWEVTEIPFEYDEEKGSYNFTCGTSGGEMLLNLDKPSDFVYAFNLLSIPFRNVYISDNALYFAGISNHTSIMFASGYKKRLWRDKLTVYYVGKTRKVESLIIKVSQFKISKSGRVRIYTLKPRFVRRYNEAIG